MGKSGGKKKKGNTSTNSSGNSILNHVPAADQHRNHLNTNSSANNAVAANGNGGIDVDPSIFLKRAHELKEEGNKRFQNKDYVGALEQYESGLRLTPNSHPDRAVFHSNRAACLMQMKPIDYDSVISECSMALQVQPRFVRALLRRARALEAIGKFEMALQDVQVLLDADSNHRDALDIARRLRTALGPQQDLQSRPSPAALGASAVRGAPIAGLGPCLPARPIPKKGAAAPVGSTLSPANKLEKNPTVAVENGQETKTQQPKLMLRPSTGSAKVTSDSGKDLGGGKQLLASLRPVPSTGRESEVAGRWRPVKLVYDHDIRLVQMPVNCSFKVLREIVSKRFPFSKSVLIKYKDNDGDLVTITSTSELKTAECAADGPLANTGDLEMVNVVGMLRLHIVEVSEEQEPCIPEEVEEEPVENEVSKGDESGSHSSLGESVLEAPDSEMDKEAPKEKTGVSEDPESKEIEMDDWLFDFAQLFRTHVGIDPDAHIDLHELGMELCTEALEETVTSEEAQSLFDKAAQKFQEVAALAFFNWGNVHMCAARKRIPLDESAGQDVVATQLQTAYEWVKDKYSSARTKYEEALVIKPDFYEGLLALGQQQFEMAKLHWSFALAQKIDLANWESTETLELFDSAEQKMKAATEMWEKMEEQRAKELKDPSSSKKEEWLRKRKKHGSNNTESEGGHIELTAEEAAEQASVMRSQIHLFWGNMLFERSQVECKLGTGDWSKNLDAAVERFRQAGAPEADISMVLKNHFSNGGPTKGEVEKANGESKVETANGEVKE
ncbi:Protein CLMP1 [Linum grandiflorum]